MMSNARLNERPFLSNKSGLCVAASVLVFFLSLRKIDDFDYWTHLYAGRELFNSLHGLADIAGFLAHLRSQVNPELPFQLLLYSLRSLGGDALVSFSVALMTTAVFTPGLFSLPRTISRSDAMLIFFMTVLVATAALFRFVPRPEMVGYLFFSVILVLARQWTIKPDWRRLIAIAALFGFWMVVHISWVIGLFLVFVQFLLTPDFAFFKEQLIARRRYLLSGVLAIMLVYALFRVAAFAWFVVNNLRTQEGIFFGVTEMRPGWEFPEVFAQYSAVSAILLLFSIMEREGRSKRIVFFVISYIVGLIVVRNTAFALLAMLSAAVNTIAASGQIPFFRQWIFRRALFVCSLFAAVFFLSQTLITNNPPRGMGIEWGNFPRDAAAFVKDAKLPGPIFNNWDCGGYLLWAWNGNPPPFLDGRLGATEKLHDHDAIVDVTGPAEALEKYGFRTILLQPLYYNSGRIVPAVYYFLSKGEWKLAWAGDALVFTRGGETTVQQINPSIAWSAILKQVRSRIQLHDDAPHLLYTQGVALFQLGLWDEGREVFQQAQQSHPELKGQYPLQ